MAYQRKLNWKSVSEEAEQKYLNSLPEHPASSPVYSSEGKADVEDARIPEKSTEEVVSHSDHLPTSAQLAPAHSQTTVKGWRSLRAVSYSVFWPGYATDRREQKHTSENVGMIVYTAKMEEFKEIIP